MDQDVVQWVARAQGGDQAAFGELVRRYHGRVYSLVYGMLNNAQDAQELEQQTWIRAWQKLGTFKREAEFFTWVYRIASNLCLDWLRHRRRVREEPLEAAVEPEPAPEVMRQPSVATAPDEALLRQERRALFERALGELSPEHRLVVQLREVDGLSYEEIAAVLKCRVGTVMSRLFYARQKLIENMKATL
ncbi:MAG: sigma-70 family RNA polymerase sigma factor [Lentisphaerae bacterium]|nr:sigma-70 family RNA polymerase sigma factor [Lentisphaerota bacterium]